MIANKNNIDYLRISVTDRCNFNCIYCLPAKPFKFINHNKIARYEEILHITKLACELGITKVRITGGEPFARKGIFSFLKSLRLIKDIKDISITTNGSLLNEEKIRKIIGFGIKRLNFSLDTLNPDTFLKITGHDKFHQVKKAILAAHKAKINPVKINTVLLKGVNDNEIEDIAALTLKYPFHIRFIEYMRTQNSRIKETEQILTKQIKQRIENKFGKLVPIEKTIHDGPAKKFKLKNAKGIIGFISPISSHFCNDCNRLRLTSRGTLRPCLLNDYEDDILTKLRNKTSDETLKKIILASINKKNILNAIPDKSNLTKAQNMPISHMYSIGG